MSYFSTIINDINGVMMYYFEFLSNEMFEEWKKVRMGAMGWDGVISAGLIIDIESNKRYKDGLYYNT